MLIDDLGGKPRHREALLVQIPGANIRYETRKMGMKTIAKAGLPLAMLMLGLAAPHGATAQAVNAQRAAAQPVVLPDTDKGRIAELVLSNHILAAQGVLDGFGHVSVRSAKNPRHYFMAVSRAPSQVTEDDIVEYDENSQPVSDLKGREQYSERLIHGEIFRARPDVMSVVHAHTPAVLPFTITKAPFQAAIHVASFLGDRPTPVWDIRDAEGPDNRMLVNNAKTGASLAKALGARRVVLMRGHGFVSAAESTQRAVFQAIYTKVNAQVEADALKLGQPVFMNQFEVMRVDRMTRQWEEWTRSIEPKP